MDKQSEKRFLCYDLKGIQSYIFAVPKLKYICGGSAIIDRFDKEKAASVQGADCLFAGGGKGAFCCDSAAVANEVKKQLIHMAHEDGVNICFGEDTDYTEAAHFAGETYPWLPADDEMDGHPCEASGLYPAGNAKDGINCMVKHRLFNKGNKMFRRFEERLLTELELENWLFGQPEQWQFMHNVDADDGDEGTYTSEALGDRNRWAVIAMDGNDMGAQHRKASENFGDDIEAMSKWIKAMSKALDECSVGACRAGIKQVLKEWAGSEEGGAYLEKMRNKPTIYLPVRPLVVGGDDIIVLCHASYARTFVTEAMRVFEELSRQKAQEAKAEDGIDLWPETNGSITITAGVLYAPVSLPLASAMSYAEALMASAKSKGRKLKESENEASPACIDWESVTEGVIDSPADRRQREMVFVDGDGDTEHHISLTRRPYTRNEFEKLVETMKRYADIPSTIRHQVLPAMRAGAHDRAVFLARLGKHQQALVEDLKDGSPHWHQAERSLDRMLPKEKTTFHETDVIDVLLLMEEDVRMTRKTAGEDK